MAKKKDNKALAVLAIIIVMAVLINTYGGSAGGPGGGPGGGDTPGSSITNPPKPVDTTTTTVPDSCVVVNGADYGYCEGSCMNILSLIPSTSTCGWDGRDCVCGESCRGIAAKSQRDCDYGLCPMTNQACVYNNDYGCTCGRPAGYYMLPT